jgi:ribosomal protein S18 acetylase RimI-like enzyme
MHPKEVGLALEWAGTEGWNPGLNDAHCFYAADPNGFLLAEMDGQPVGCISAVKYGEDFGFLGLYIIVPEHRGKGYGIALWNAAMDSLEGRNVGLDGVVAQQDNYRKSGFVLAHRNVRYELTPDDVRGGLAEKIMREAQADGVAIVPLTDVPFDDVLKYDVQCFGFERAAFIKALITQPQGIALGAMKEGQLSGFGVLRPCRSGAKVGPLFCNSPSIAGRLFKELVRQYSGDGSIFLDVPQVNTEAVSLAEKAGMIPMFETARMYTKGDPGLPLDRIFGISTFELG